MNDKEQLEFCKILDDWYLDCKGQFGDKPHPLGMRKEDLKSLVCKWIESKNFFSNEPNIAETKYPTKAQLMWDISREMEDDFIKSLFPNGFINQIELKKDEVIELFKAIRSAEYRRGKEDGRKNA